MKLQKSFGMKSLGVLALAGAGVSVASFAAAPPSPPATRPAALGKPATSAELGGDRRYLTAVSTDKPIYLANEKVWARAILLDAATHAPRTEVSPVYALAQVLGPKGETVASANLTGQGGDPLAFGWTVPDTATGGQYTLKITYPRMGYTPAERKFDVRAYRAPRLRNQVTFLRDGYGPGERVTASVHSERAEGGFPAGAKVTVTARVDDHQVYSAPASVNAAGDCTASFDLPKQIARGEGTLAFAIEDGGVVETASKTIPILLQTVDLSIYPEGGDAVAGVDNRYYIEAKTPAGKPADLAGEIVDSAGKKVADIKTEHEGRGRFDFTPQKGQAYTLKLTQPAGIARTWTVPAAKDSGVVIHLLDDVVAMDQPVRVRITPVGNVSHFHVTLTRHETTVLHWQDAKQDGAGAPYLELTPMDNADGVLTLTVWGDDGAPLAERLVYRQPAHSIHVRVTPDQTTYTPGGKATLDIVTTDESGKPVAADVGLTVTDDTVQQMIEKREQAPGLEEMVLLEPEVKELADATAYLDPKNPKGGMDTDLLLGTQGWRRFAMMDTKDFLAKYGDQGKRALAFSEAPVPVAERFGGPVGGIGVFNMAVPVFAATAPALLPEGAVRKLAEDEDLARDKDLALFKQNRRALDQGKAEAAPLARQDRELAGGGFGGGGFGGRGGGFGQAAISGDFTFVREYAHALRPGWSSSDRSDFTETVYWNADLKTDATGHAKASFNLADSVTSFRVFSDAFDKNGSLGESATTIQSVQPFYIEPKLPLEVSTGDVVEFPVAIANNTPRDLAGLNLAVSGANGLNLQPPPPMAAPMDWQP